MTHVNLDFLFLCKTAQMDSLIHKYASVCNEALMGNRDRFPFNHILSAAKESASGRTVEVEIVPSSPDEKYILKLDKNRIIADEHALCGNCSCDARWRVPRDFLEDVAKNPLGYITNPARLNWEWLYDVEGMKRR